ncbi:MAG TPA: Coenzyme F420 hydrogenase/dehydrogenase, beta subunit C-terminal domain [Thermoanaerobaculia bacterium]|nr:Coenzyme F420 hydrogenase/dehydrogenase, beta subunit C-terminal domain [Thermoanaerobaculia bacterium]
MLDQDLCIACGACVHADPTQRLEIHPEKQIYEPIHAGDERAARVCPAVQVDFDRLHRELFPGAEVGPFGVVDSVMLAQSRNLERNLKASSGGLIKELLIELLGRPEVDGAVVLAHVRGLEFEPRVITRADEVDTLPGSIYHNLPKHGVLDLLKELEGRYVLVGIPCEFEGIFQYILEYEPHLRERIHSTIGLLCGWQYNYHALRAICEFRGLDFDRIQEISYRGSGPVGKLRIQADGRTLEASRRVDFGYQVAFDRTFNTSRCHLCINHANFLADIVVGDAWLPSTVTTQTGISLLIARRPEATALVETLHRTGRIVVTEVTTAEIEESQTHRIAMGDFAYAYAEYLDELGLHRPDMTGPNRPEAGLAPRSEVAEFHRELRAKTGLQRQGRYRYLRVRKATKELRKFLWRYLRWFLVRILRVKSLTGQRREVSRAQLRGFR